MSAKSKSKSSGKLRGTQRVCLYHPHAKGVCIAGTFNDWNPTVTRMVRLKDGKWATELALAPGRYEYRFVVDGQWMDDPAATEVIPNPFGTMNAVLAVTEAVNLQTQCSQQPKND